MSDPKPILAYASPVGSASTSNNITSFTFASPPVKPEIRMNIVVLILCWTAAVALLIVAVLEEVDPRHYDGGPVAIGIAILGSAVVFAIGIARIWEIKRLKTFGEDPIRIELIDSTFQIAIPVNAKPLKLLDVADIRSIQLRKEGAMLGGVNIFVIVFRLAWRSEFTLRKPDFNVRVAVHDRGVITRAVDDLRNAIKLANQTPIEPQMNADQRR